MNFLVANFEVSFSISLELVFAQGFSLSYQLILVQSQQNEHA